MIDEKTRQQQYAARKRFVFRAKIGILAGLLLLIFAFIFIKSNTYSGFVLDPTLFTSVRYQGYDGKAGADIVLDRSALSDLLSEAYLKYAASIFPLEKNHTKDDFDAFGKTIACTLNRSEGLKNGDELEIDVSCDMEEAKALGLSLKFDEMPFTVSDLAEGVTITKDQIFGDLTISVNGISPVIKLAIKNDSRHDFIRNITYEIKPSKDFYKMGETVRIRAKYDEEAAIREHYAIEKGADELEYVIPGDIRYVEGAEDLDDETLKEAIERAKECFSGANEWGLRIFTEAHLPYRWAGTGDYTFEWSDPRLLTAYVEKVKNEYRSDESKPFNYLELAFEVHISQADGVGCDAEAVVCFDSMTVDKDGRVDINPDSAQLFTASYLDKNIKSTLRGWFGDYYNLDRIDLSGVK